MRTFYGLAVQIDMTLNGKFTAVKTPGDGTVHIVAGSFDVFGGISDHKPFAVFDQFTQVKQYFGFIRFIRP